MTTSAAPPPIGGTPIDPPPKERAATISAVEDRSAVAGVGFRAFLRFSTANASLLAAGTTYYLFLSLFALVALAFGITAMLGSEDLAASVTEALDTAFPGLTGDTGIDAAQLRSIGQATSALGLLVLLYSGSGVMGAAAGSLHLIYGAPKDPRGFLLAKARLLLWLLVIAPLVLLSFAPSVLVSFAQPVLEFLGIEGSAAEWLLIGVSLLFSLLLDFLVIYLLLGILGGIRPHRRPRVTGAAVGAALMEVLKSLMAGIVAWSVSKPQYGAFAAPIAVLLVLYLQTLILYASAALTAAVAEREEPVAGPG